MYVKPIPPCPTCLGEQKVHGLHKTWEDCSDTLRREDLQSNARRVRPRRGTISQAYAGKDREYA